MLFTSCKKQNTKQRILSNVENLQYDTIKARPVDMSNMTHADSCRYRADEVLRKYPEMYHATDIVTEAYNKWASQEREFIEKTLVGKNGHGRHAFDNKAAALEHRLQQLNFIEPLMAIIIDGADESSFRSTNLSTPDEDAMKQYYRTIFLRIGDGIKNTNNDYSSDEMRTACEKARLDWSNYIKKANELLQTMPAECQPAMYQAICNIICLHAIDLHNCYVQYWTDHVPGFILKDDCQNEDFEAADYKALLMLKWMKE